MSFFGGLQIVKNPCFLDEEKDNCALVHDLWLHQILFIDC